MPGKKSQRGAAKKISEPKPIESKRPKRLPSRLAKDYALSKRRRNGQEIKIVVEEDGSTENESDSDNGFVQSGSSESEEELEEGSDSEEEDGLNVKRRKTQPRSSTTSTRRGPGRPPAAEKKRAGRPPATEKRGPGRPPAAEKRGPGRPPATEKRGPGRPPATEKRGPGRPPATEKRGPGRPPATERKKPGRKPAVKKKPETVSNRTIQRINQSAIVAPLRQVNKKEYTTSLDAYALARQKLHVSAVPDSLPCREEEFMTITGYLESAIQESTGTCIYISGVPGTGKTATVHEVIRHLQHEAEQGNMSSFDFAEINGMKLTDPNQAYGILWDCMNRSTDIEKKRKYTSAHAQQLLETKFSKPNEDQRVTVVLMDELDLLVTKKQTVMYNFFDWPSRPLSKLVVVAIANTMDLPERLMSNKIASRMGLTRINFQPYTHDQLDQIVQSRLQGIDAFAKGAVEFAARKVSAVSGDARRALDICRRAVEIVEKKSAKDTTNEKKMQVTIAVIDEAIKEMYTSPSVAFIRSCSLHQKVFLVSCMQRSRAVGLAEIEFGDIAHYHVQNCKWHNIEPLNTGDMMRVCESLGQTRALVIEGGRMDIYMRISLNLMEEDIIMACKDDKLINKLLNNLPSSNV